MTHLWRWHTCVTMADLCAILQAKKSQTVETNLKNITSAKFELDFEVSIFGAFVVHLLLFPYIHAGQAYSW